MLLGHTNQELSSNEKRIEWKRVRERWGSEKETAVSHVSLVQLDQILILIMSWLICISFYFAWSVTVAWWRLTVCRSQIPIGTLLRYLSTLGISKGLRRICNQELNCPGTTNKRKTFMRKCEWPSRPTQRSASQDLQQTLASIEEPSQV